MIVWINPKYLLVFLILGVGSVFGQAQTSAESYRAFDREHWQETIEDIDYSGDRAAKQKKKEAREGEKGRGGELAPERRVRRSIISGPLAGLLLKILIIVAIGFLVFLILRAFLGVSLPKNKKIKKASLAEIDLDKMEENLLESDFQHYLQQALEQGNYKLAIRLYYLHLLKELSLRSLIRWKKDKTNRDYALELRGTKLDTPFHAVTYIFDRVWYGGGQLDAQEYAGLAPHFKAFDQQIAATKNGQ